MRLFALFVACIVSLASAGASYVWEANQDVMGGSYYPERGLYWYDFFGGLYEKDSEGKATGNGVAGLRGTFQGYLEGGTFNLKQLDHKTTPMPVDDPQFVIAYYGLVLNENTFDAVPHIPFSDWEYDMPYGGISIAGTDDFYLGFIYFDTDQDGMRKQDGRTWYGWVRVSLDDEFTMHLIDSSSNASFEGGEITVGVHWTDEPEPATGTLAALGLAAMLLRRRRIYSVASFA